MLTFTMIALIGLLAGATMSAFLIFIESRYCPDVKDFWIFGRLFSRDPQRARKIGITVHALGGIFFAFPYVMVWSLWNPEALLLWPAIGILTGAFHGVATSFSHLILLPSRQEGFNIGVSHFASHAVYGFVLATIVAITSAATSGSMSIASSMNYEINSWFDDGAITVAAIEEPTITQ